MDTQERKQLNFDHEVYAMHYRYMLCIIVNHTTAYKLLFMVGWAVWSACIFHSRRMATILQPIPIHLHLYMAQVYCFTVAKYARPGIESWFPWDQRCYSHTKVLVAILDWLKFILLLCSLSVSPKPDQPLVAAVMELKGLDGIRKKVRIYNYRMKELKQEFELQGISYYNATMHDSELMYKL